MIDLPAPWMLIYDKPHLREYRARLRDQSKRQKYVYIQQWAPSARATADRIVVRNGRGRCTVALTIDGALNLVSGDIA